MASTFPSAIGALATPQPTDRLNNPSHSTLHQNENNEILQVERFIGTIPASAVGTLIYDIRSPDSGGGGHVQTANKGGTGQTSFNKGDLLVGQSSSVIAKLSIGTDGQFLVADSSQAAGVKWGVGLSPTVRLYNTSSVTTSGTTSLIGMWFKPSTLSYAVIEITGGGGGGGGTTTANIGAGGGGGGAYARKTVSAASLPLAASVLVGTGGAGGPATGGAGGAAGTTLFGSVMSATGGNGSTGTNTTTGASGGTATGGDLNIKGGPGADGINAANPTSGTGGYNPLGTGGQNASGSNTGGDGNKYGGGGGGAASTGPDEAGGNGADGIIVIYEY